MQYYLSVTVTGKLKLSDKDSFDPKYFAATVIGRTAEELRQKLEKQGYRVEVDLSHGYSNE